jgi:hypothetical protein
MGSVTDWPRATPGKRDVTGSNNLAGRWTVEQHRVL